MYFKLIYRFHHLVNFTNKEAFSYVYHKREWFNNNFPSLIVDYFDKSTPHCLWLDYGPPLTGSGAKIVAGA